MFFQRKKKRLLRELWRSRLAKPPSLPLSYAHCSPGEIHHHHQQQPQPQRWTLDGDQNGFGLGDRDVNHLPCCHHQQEAKETSTTCRRTATRAGQGFCLMGNCCGDSQSTCSSVDGNQIYADEEAEEKAFLAFLGKTLSQRQLESMLDSANARAGQTTTSSSSTINHSACVLIRRQEAMNWSEELPVIACRMWRWTDLDMRTDVLRRIPSCPNGRDPVYICCNPSHWFRVLQPELPPPPYSATLDATVTTTTADQQLSVSDYGRRRFNSPPILMDADHDHSTPKDLSQSSLTPQKELQNYHRVDDNSSTMTSSPPHSGSTHDGQDLRGWCSLAYWEQSVRVGAVIKMDRNTMNVVAGLPFNDDLCLSSLAADMPKKLQENATRGKIGAGITISHEGDSMWLYNRSKNPVFVHSLTICEVDNYLGNSTVVFKLYPGYCMRAYNPRAKMDRYLRMAEMTGMGPVDVHSVRISFVKGWGQTYKRQDIKSCPCWLEVILNPSQFQSAVQDESWSDMSSSSS